MSINAPPFPLRNCSALHRRRRCSHQLPANIRRRLRTHQVQPRRQKRVRPQLVFRLSDYSKLNERRESSLKLSDMMCRFYTWTGSVFSFQPQQQQQQLFDFVGFNVARCVKDSKVSIGSARSIILPAALARARSTALASSCTTCNRICVTDIVCRAGPAAAAIA